MRPAFTTVKLEADKKRVSVGGPIDLSGNEISAYFWVRVAQGEEGSAVDAVGIYEMDGDAVKAAVKQVDTEVKGVVEGAIAAAAGASGTTTARNVPKKIRDVTASWGPMTCTHDGDGEFVKTKPVRVEAWALVRTLKPKRTFHVYWDEDGVKLK